jgi:hypothetical protein
MSYEYKAIPFKAQLSRKDTANAIATQLENLINDQAIDGWEFDCLDDVGVSIEPGCISALLGGRTQYLRYDIVIFRRSRTE